MRLLCMTLAMAALLFGQEGAAPAEPKKAKEKEAPKVAPLKPGEVKILQAIVMDVKGVAQARETVKTKDGEKPAAAKWAVLKVNDVLKPGVVVRTGRESQVTLRIGSNATMLIERQSRVRIPEIAQKGKVLRTRVSMAFGKADVKVDRIGLENDFEVATPTATLAVRGTVFRIWWDVVNGFRAIGVPGNKIRAIEVNYVNGVKAYLSKADSTASGYALPALDAFYATYIAPLEGALSSGEYGETVQGSTEKPNVTKDSGLATSRKDRGGTITRGPNDPDNPPPGQPPK